MNQRQAGATGSVVPIRRRLGGSRCDSGRRRAHWVVRGLAVHRQDETAVLVLVDPDRPDEHG